MADVAPVAAPKSILKKPSRNARVVPKTAPPVQSTSTQLPAHLQRLVSGNEQTEQPSLAAQLIAGTAPPPANAREKRNREVALHHANLIQRRKDLEADILASTETLIDLPAALTASASRPHAADVDTFQRLIPPFNTTDYDELINERVCVDKCGYVFCPQQVVKDYSTGANYNRVQYLGGGEINIVKRTQTEMWCSAACARRAMYIKVQLSETPAWERLGGIGGPVELLQQNDEDVLADKMEQLGLAAESGENMVKAMEELALERGEHTDSVLPSLVMKGQLVEKDAARPPMPPSGDIGNPGSIESHVPLQKGARLQAVKSHHKHGKARSENETHKGDYDEDDYRDHDDDDDDDNDWDLS